MRGGGGIVSNNQQNQQQQQQNEQQLQQLQLNSRYDGNDADNNEPVNFCFVLTQIICLFVVEEGFKQESFIIFRFFLFFFLDGGRNPSAQFSH